MVSRARGEDRNRKKNRAKKKTRGPHLWVHVEGVQPPLGRERGENASRVPSASERAVHVHASRVGAHERIQGLAQHSRRVRARFLLRRAHAEGSRLGDAHADVAPAETRAVPAQTLGARRFGRERHETSPFTPPGLVADQAHVALERTEVLREERAHLGFGGFVREVLDEHLVPVAVVALRGRARRRRGGLRALGRETPRSGRERRGEAAGGTPRLVAPEARASPREVHGAARARPVVCARVVARRAAGRGHAERKRRRRGARARRGRPRLAGRVPSKGASARLTPPVALPALLNDVFDFLHGGVDVSPADFADALLLAHAQHAPGELLDLANLRAALPDDAAGLAGTLHLNDVPARLSGVAGSPRRRPRAIRAFADLVIAGVVRVRGGEGVGPEIVSDDAHEPPLELGLVERRRRVRRRVGVGHDRGGFAGEQHHLGRVHAEERRDRGGVRVGRHRAHANARDRAIGTAAHALAAAALLLGAFRRLARLARGGVLGRSPLALLLLGLLLLGSHRADAPRDAARSAARAEHHREVGLLCFSHPVCAPRRSHKRVPRSAPDETRDESQNSETKKLFIASTYR